MAKNIPPVHPGEILLEEYLEPLGISQNALARALRVTPQRVNKIVKGQNAVRPEMAMRLGRYFRTSTEFWLNLQMRYDLQVAEDSKAMDTIRREVRAIDRKRLEASM